MLLTKTEATPTRKQLSVGSWLTTGITTSNVCFYCFHCRSISLARHLAAVLSPIVLVIAPSIIPQKWHLPIEMPPETPLASIRLPLN
ncbi:MAG TPA: hypothetical protein VKX46_04435 [Ktedonobacteraceae bacterium]|nr:hypothetical protein [Ktedonobacteraceae bacterium]